MGLDPEIFISLTSSFYFSLRSLSLKFRTASRSNSILFLSFGALIPPKSLRFLL
ncbi:hypothetical protein DsansV1_C29g0213731 [Dioscorea sansibarensis]